MKTYRPALLALAISLAIQAPAYASGGACGREAGPAIFNTFENGYVSLNGNQQSNDVNGRCNLTITGSDDVNVASSRFYQAGDCGLEATDINLGKLNLPYNPFTQDLQQLIGSIEGLLKTILPDLPIPLTGESLHDLIDLNPLDIIYRQDRQVELWPDAFSIAGVSVGQINAYTDSDGNTCWYYGNTPNSGAKCKNPGLFGSLVPNQLETIPLTGAVLPVPAGSGNPLLLRSAFPLEDLIRELVPGIGNLLANLLNQIPLLPEIPSMYDGVLVSNGKTIHLRNSEQGDDLLDIVTNPLGNMLWNADSGKVPMLINELNCTQGKLQIEPGDYYINKATIDGCNIEVIPDKNGNKERVNLRINQIYKIYGNINYDQNKAPEEQNPENLAIFVNNGDLLINNSSDIAAGIYVDKGNIVSETGDLTFVGEMLAQNIGVQNNANSRFHYKDTKLFGNAYAAASSPREGEFSLAAPAIPRVTKTGDFAFVPVQKDTDGIMGDIKAYKLQADGSTEATASWNANAKMSVDVRRNKLYSTNAAGSALVKFNDLDDAAFAAATAPTVAQIKAYTLNPNDSGGIYLAGRASDSLIGRPYTTQPAILGNLVLFQTDDGFLYAIDKTSGDLKWGYIPRPLVAELKNYATFFKTHPMEGQIAILPDSEGSTAGYVVGSAKGGALHYALQVDVDGNLVSQLWLDSRTGSNPHRPLVLKVGNTNYVWYVAENTKLVRRELARIPAESVQDYKTITSDKTLTAAPALVSRIVDGKQWVRLFLGDETGKVYLSELTDNNGLANNPRLSRIGDIKVDGTSALDGKVLWLEHARKGDKDYLTAQSKQILTTFISRNGTDYNVDTWASFIGGSKALTSGKTCPARQNFTQADENASKAYDCVQQLPAPAPGSTFPSVTITGAVNIGFSTVYLPIQYETKDACLAQNYLYKLENGNFPTNIYYFGKLLTDNLTLGEHEALRPQMSILNGKPMMFSGASEMGQYNNGDDTHKVQAAGAPTFSNISNYPSGWRELIKE